LASKHTCHCGTLIRTNLYEGHGVSLLVPESLTDVPSSAGLSPDQLLDHLIRESKVVAQCPTCGTLSIIDKEYRVEYFAPLKVPGPGSGESDA